MSAFTLQAPDTAHDTNGKTLYARYTDPGDGKFRAWLPIKIFDEDGCDTGIKTMQQRADTEKGKSTYPGPIPGATVIAELIDGWSFEVSSERDMELFMDVVRHNAYMRYIDAGKPKLSKNEKDCMVMVEGMYAMGFYPSQELRRAVDLHANRIGLVI